MARPHLILCSVMYRDIWGYARSIMIYHRRPSSNIYFIDLIGYCIGCKYIGQLLWNIAVVNFMVPVAILTVSNWCYIVLKRRIYSHFDMKFFSASITWSLPHWLNLSLVIDRIVLKFNPHAYRTTSNNVRRNKMSACYKHGLKCRKTRNSNDCPLSVKLVMDYEIVELETKEWGNIFAIIRGWGKILLIK